MKEAKRSNPAYKNKLGVAINRNDYVFVDQVYAAPIGKPVRIQTGRRPFSVDRGGYEPLSCFSVEIAFYDEDAGDDELIGRFTRTFYLEDFLKKLGKKGVYQDADYGQTRVNYYRDGPYIIGDFIIKKPGGALGELRLRVRTPAL